MRRVFLNYVVESLTGSFLTLHCTKLAGTQRLPQMTQQWHMSDSAVALRLMELIAFIFKKKGNRRKEFDQIYSRFFFFLISLHSCLLLILNCRGFPLIQFLLLILILKQLKAMQYHFLV